MKNGWFFWILLLVACKSRPIDYPETRKADTVGVYFGTQVADPYRWLEDPSSDETKAWIDAQNKVTMTT